MRGLFFFIIATLCIVSNAQSITPELPNLPRSPLTAKDIETAVANDTPEAWKSFADSAKAKAVDLAAKQFYLESAGWLYVYLAADLFEKNFQNFEGSTIKRIILSDIPAFFDFYESITPLDDVPNACKVLSQIYKIYPKSFEKYIRSAYAVALIYDVPPPGAWPVCNTPSDPVSLTQPQEVFNIFLENPEKFLFPMDKMVVAELVWIFGVAGPLDELRELRRDNITPAMIERLTQSIKTDTSRLERRRFTDWNVSERPFTPQNILKYGGSPFEKVYCAWRIANANGIPCLYFSESGSSGLTSWLAYMSRPGVWKFNVARSPEAKMLFGRPLNPQTWGTAKQFDIDMLTRRHITSEAGVLSLYFLRVSELLYDSGKYNDSAIFAEKAKKENPDNWKAYIAYINARARFGASSRELDDYWRKSYEAFRRYPDMCIFMLNKYRENLIALRRGKEADRLLTAEMRGVMRSDAGLGIDIYSNQITDIFKRAQDKTEVFATYQDILRNSNSCQSECFRKIVQPLAKLFVDASDVRSAVRVVNLYYATLRDDSLKASAEKFRETLAPAKGKKSSEED